MTNHSKGLIITIFAVLFIIPDSLLSDYLAQTFIQLLFGVALYLGLLYCSDYAFIMA